MPIRLQNSIAAVLFFYFSLSVHAQLSAFNFSLTVTPETCTGNGGLAFAVSNTTPGASLSYAIYLLPNTSTPIAVTSLSSYGGLASGSYWVVATQSLGNLSNTKDVNVQILDQRVPLVYQTSLQRVDCSNANLTVQVSSGIPVTYEIISGPQTAQPQTSNFFPNLSPGVYAIRVTDICGEALVQTVTINFTNLPNINFQGFTSLCDLVSCTVLAGQLGLASSLVGVPIRYPLQVETIVYPPGGGTPITTMQTGITGNPESVSIPMQIPFYDNQSYQYSFVVTDACGLVYTSPLYSMNQSFTVGLGNTSLNCEPNLTVSLCNYVLPVQIGFLDAPQGFNPVVFNPNHPGPFSSAVIQYLSNGSNSIPTGSYTVQVTDACGRVDTATALIRPTQVSYTLTPLFENCQTFNELEINLGTEEPGAQIIFEQAPPAYTTTLPLDVSNLISGQLLTQTLPAGDYVVSGVNGCGTPFNFSFTIEPIFPEISVYPSNLQGCGGNGVGAALIMIEPVATLQSILLITAPSTYPNTLPFDYSALIEMPAAISALVEDLPFGIYTFQITDSCGNTTTKSVALNVFVNTSPSFVATLAGCGVGKVSVKLTSPNGTFVSCLITQAPVSYPFPLPHNLNASISNPQGIIVIDDLPEGSYTIETVDICGVIRVENYTFTGYAYTDNCVVIPQCNAFSLQVDVVDNNETPHAYWLQKWNPSSNQWVHPLTGGVYPAGTDPNPSNSLPLTLGLNANIVSEGRFRILSVFEYYSYGNVFNEKCYQTIKEFDFTDELYIVDALGLNCANGNSIVLINAQGIPPLQYTITAFNGNPFFLDNGNSAVFSGLPTGLYNFTVEDNCGNIVNRDFDIGLLNQPTITANNLCEGEVGQLAIDLVGFYTYQWYNAENPTVILSTSNVLTFSPFSNATTPGTYVVSMQSSIPATCSDQQFSFVVPYTPAPNAGGDGILEVCEQAATIDLFSILQGTYTTGGQWLAVTPGGVLTGSQWDASSVPFGTYTFQYLVSDLCSESDQSQVTIVIKEPIPTINLAQSTQACVGSALQIDAPVIPNASYSWSGPNGFSSTSSTLNLVNIQITDAGNYTLIVTRDGCERQHTILLNVNPLPEYSLNQACVGGRYTVEVLVANASFDSQSANYTWSGPSGFTATGNPIQLIQEPAGAYTVTVTDIQGCQFTLPFQVLSTLCEIPNVITPNQDGSNDSFDLTGFIVNRIEVFNRWGRKVYEKSNYTNEWYGQNQRGESLPDGVYYYYVEFEGSTTKHGWVLLNTGR